MTLYSGNDQLSLLLTCDTSISIKEAYVLVRMARNQHKNNHKNIKTFHSSYTYTCAESEDWNLKLVLPLVLLYSHLVEHLTAVLC